VTSTRTRRGVEHPHRASQKPLSSSSQDPASYGGQPVIKPPVWEPAIAAYFFFGGLAGAAAPLAALAELSGNERLARRTWPVALGAVAASPPILIYDLGRPERFLYMLRLAKVTSPMSVGTWILSASGAAVTAATARSLLGRLPRLGAAGGASMLALGPALASYTAALVAQTSVPAWHEARRELPWVFTAGAAASAGAAAAALTPGRDGAPARRLAIGGAVVEAAASTVMERRLGELVSEPYRTGRAGLLHKASRGLSLGGAAAMAAARGRRGLELAGAGAMLAGALAARFAVYHAGNSSARDPRYTVVPQRERLERGAAHRQSEEV
jgi:hypothetical protein